MPWADLSVTLRGGMPVYPGDAAVELLREREFQRDGYTAYLLRTGLHAGTHVDLPMHLSPSDRYASSYPPESFCGRGVLFDVRGRREIVPPPDAGRIGPGDVVLLYTGTDRLYGTGAYYTDGPVVTPEFARLLADRGVRMLGMDMPSPDRPPFPVHRLLLGRGVFLLENLTGLSALMGWKSFEVFAVPLRIDAEASPVRAFARTD